MGYNYRRILVLGDKKIAERTVKAFVKHPEYGFEMTDFISQRQMKAMSDETLFNTITSVSPDEIFVCFKTLKPNLLNKLIHFGNENSIKVKLVSDLILNNSYAHLVNYNNLPILHVTSQPDVALKVKILKRGFDVFFSLGVMTAGAPIFALLYIITRVTSRGPGFYRQERIGRNGKPFYIYKFRSMFIDAEQDGPQLAQVKDPRVTKWGFIIRKSRLDELPQFWNVFKGNMSVVGPRPERQHFIERIIEKTPHYKKLLRLKPGLTSIGQVHYGYAENIDQMCARVRYDLIYLQNVNLSADLNIIYKTVKVMIQGKGQ